MLELFTSVPSSSKKFSMTQAISLPHTKNVSFGTLNRTTGCHRS
ncbi:hypothetical protein BH10ACT1_BH10ACT1_18270 [soil metagenome]